MPKRTKHADEPLEPEPEPEPAAEAEEPKAEAEAPPLAEADVSPAADTELAQLEAAQPSAQDRLAGDLTVPMRDLEEPFSGVFSDVDRTEGQPYRRPYPAGKPENYRRSGG